MLPIFKHCLYWPISDNFLDYVDITLLFLLKQKPILNSNDIKQKPILNSNDVWLCADSFCPDYKSWFIKNGKN